jgi:hypothetical protein
MNQKGKINWILTAVLAVLMVSAQLAGVAQTRKISVKFRGVYDSKITLSPFNGVQVAKPIGEVKDIMPGDVVDFDIPAQYLPGEFLIRFDYRAKKEDAPYPSEIQLYINQENIGVDAHPMYTNGDSLRLTNDRENAAWFAFQKTNGRLRQQMGLLQQLLAQYDQPQSAVWNQADASLEVRRIKYNAWIDSLTLANRDLYVSHLYGFQHLNANNWKSKPDDQMNAQAKMWFDHFNASDTLVIRSRQMNEFISGFIGLFGPRATTEALRDSLFTQAGRQACTAASKGDPKVYGWMVDYFYNGFSTYNITAGLTMLEKYSADPRCHTSRKAEIARRTVGIKTLVPGVIVPKLTLHNFDDLEVAIDTRTCDKAFRLILFYDSECSHCHDLLAALQKWYAVTENSVWLNVVTIALDRTREDWEPFHTAKAFPWTDLYAPEGINSTAAADFYVLSAPYMFLVDKSGKLIDTPDTIEEMNEMIKGK